MTIILLAFIIYCLITANYKNPFKNEYHDDNFSKTSTDCINGIFVFLVFLSHFHWEIEKFYSIDFIYNKFQRLCGQCIVCSFLFYSGYGIYENLKINRFEYSKKLVLKKIPQLLLRFDICVIFYAITQFCLGNVYSISDYLLSLLTIKNLGNSNWYISYILLMYFIIWLSFTLFKNDTSALLLIVILNIIYIILLSIYNPSASHYYVTSLIMPLGMYYSKFKDKIEQIIGKKKFFIFILTTIIYFVCWLYKSKSDLPQFTYNIISILFTIVLILMTYTIKFKNPLLILLGKNVFQIYIMQHLPMIVFKPIQKYYGYIFYFILCVIGTIILTLIINIIFKIITIKNTSDSKC